MHNFRAIPSLSSAFMAFVGYYEFSHHGVVKLGFFISGTVENIYSVQLVRELGEEHLRYLPMVFLDRRRTYQLSADEIYDKNEVYVFNHRHFAEYSF